MSELRDRVLHVNESLLDFNSERDIAPMGRAIGYLLNHEIPLRRFLDDGVVPIDNGIVERLHVRAALTRKNFLFAGSDAGGERAAVAYTILGSCQLAGINPAEYLADVLPRLSRRVRLSELPALLPARWNAAASHSPLADLQPHVQARHHISPDGSTSQSGAAGRTDTPLRRSPPAPRR